MRKLSKLLLVLIVTTNLLTDAPTVEALLVQSFGPQAVLLTRNRAASVDYCFAIEHFQPPTITAPFSSSPSPNPRVGEPMPLTDIKTCQASPFDVLVFMLRKPVPPWPVPFIVSPQQ